MKQKLKTFLYVLHVTETFRAWDADPEPNFLKCLIRIRIERIRTRPAALFEYGGKAANGTKFHPSPWK